MKLNCIIVDDDPLAHKVIEKYIDQTDFLELKGNYYSAIEAKNICNLSDIDLIFLDIEMPEMTGLEFIKSITNIPQVILITGNKKYALEAFDYDVTDFLLKPISYPRFLRASTKALDMNESVQSTKTDTGDVNEFFVKKNSRLLKVNVNDIIWIEALADYVRIFTTEDKFIVHSTMKGILAKLPPNDFSRVHRSYIIRIDKIGEIQDNTIVLDNKLIPISRSYKEPFMKRINLI